MIGGGVRPGVAVPILPPATPAGPAAASAPNAPLDQRVRQPLRPDSGQRHRVDQLPGALRITADVYADNIDSSASGTVGEFDRALSVTQRIWAGHPDRLLPDHTD